VKSSYETITSIHIYSISAYRLQDLQTLSDTGRHLYEMYFVKEDPLEHNTVYGAIVNKNVRRRTGRRPPPPTIEPKATIISETTSGTNSNTAEKPAGTCQPSVKKEETSRPSSAGSTTPTSTTTKQPSLKRDTSDIFKAFSKAKNSAAKSKASLTRNGTDSSVGSKSEDKDGKLLNDSEDECESEEEALFLDTKTRTSAKKRSSTGKSEREAKLRMMMDDSDEEMEDAQLIDPEEAGLGTGDQPKNDRKSEAAALKQGTAQADDAEEGGEGVNWSDSDTEQQQPQQPKKNETASAATEPESDHQNDPSAPPKRRRAKRKVMRKKTMKDEEGYLVTREEAAWESFSEDEPVPAKTKPKPPVASKAQSQSQSHSQSQGKGGAKEKGKQKGGGGGNIMSFFGKK
jgi:DNA polymerase delta subunit 3